MGKLDGESDIGGVGTLSKGDTRVGGKVAGIIDQPKMHDSMVVQERVWRLEEIAMKLDSISDALMFLPKAKLEILTSPAGQKYIASLRTKLLDMRTELSSLNRGSKLGPILIINMDKLLDSIKRQDWESCKIDAVPVFNYIEGFCGVLDFISDQDITVVDVP